MPFRSCQGWVQNLRRIPLLSIVRATGGLAPVFIAGPVSIPTLGSGAINSHHDPARSPGIQPSWRAGEIADR